MANTASVAPFALLLCALCCGISQAVLVSFNHGVASGDPLPTAVILWTRVTPRTEMNSTNVRWVVSTNMAPSTAPIAGGVITTSAAKDWTVKGDVTGLPSGTQLYFQFIVLGADNGSPAQGPAFSPVGTFRLPGATVEKLRYAVFSCSNYGWGFFNAYEAASTLNLDFWIHLGDWLYEYGTDDYPTATQAVRYQAPPQGLQPPTEMGAGTDKVMEYRMRHAMYRQDPAVQLLSARAPLIAIWDDHEFVNDAWTGGAENHNETTEGSFADRKAAAIQVYFEWMPIRDTVGGASIGAAINRTFHFGKLASLIMFEGRVTARTARVTFDPFLAAGSQAAFNNPNDLSPEQIGNLTQYAAYSEMLRLDPSRKIMGDAQVAWVGSETAASVAAGKTWQLYGSQTVMFDTKINIDAAIAAAPDNATAAIWREAITNITTVGAAGLATFKSYSTTCYARGYLGATIPVTPSVLGSARAAYAVSRFNMTLGYDAWEGNLVEKRSLLSTIKSKAANVVIYAGDSHNDWAGVNKLDGATVGAQFAGSAVSSPGFEEYFGILPLDMIAASLVAGSSYDGMQWANTDKKGFLYVELDQYKQRVNYVKTDHCQMAYKPKLLKCFDYYSKAGQAKYGKEDRLYDFKCRGARLFGTGPYLPYTRLPHLNSKFAQSADFN